VRISGLLEVDLSPAVDDLGYFTGRDAAALVPAIPAGVTVELCIGNGTPLDGLLGPLISELRPAGAVVVRGTNSNGIAKVYDALAIAYARKGAA
jgi:hypothetical protein